MPSLPKPSVLVAGVLFVVTAAAAGLAATADPDVPDDSDEGEASVANGSGLREGATNDPGIDQDLSLVPEPDLLATPEATPLSDSVNLLTLAQQTLVGRLEWTPQGNSLVSIVDSPSEDALGGLRIRVDRSGPYPDETGTARVGTLPGKKAVPISAGVTIAGAVKLTAVSSDSTARCEIRWYDAEGRVLATDEGESASVTRDGWTQLMCKATAPVNAAFVALRIHLAETALGDVFVADDAWLIRPDVASPLPTEPIADPTPASDPTVDPEPLSSEMATGSRPGPATTGVTDEAALRQSGSITTSRDGQVIENFEVDGSITVKHDDVAIRNVRVLGTGRYGISVPSSLHDDVTGLLIEDVEIIGVSGERSSGLVHYGEWTARRVEVSGYVDGVKMGSGQILENSWIHDLHQPSGAHNDGIQIRSGSNSVIRRNYIDNPFSQTSAILMQTGDGPISDWTIEGNWLAGGGYTVYIVDKGYGPPTNIRVRDNVWIADSWDFGPLSLVDRQDTLAFEGNSFSNGRPYSP